MSKRKKYKVGKEANPQSNAIFWDRFSLWFMDKYGLDGLDRLKSRKGTRSTKSSRRERELAVTVKA